MTTVITVLGPDGDVRWVTPTVHALVGFEAHEWVGRNVLELIHPDDRDVIEPLVDASVTGRPITIAHRLRHAAGHWVPIRSMVQLVPSGDEDIVITVSTRAADASGPDTEVGERYRTLVETSTELLAVTMDGVVVSASKPTLELVADGRPDLLIGHQVLDFVVPASTPQAEDRMRRIRIGEWPAPETIGIRTVDGSVVDVEVSSVPTLWDGQVATQLTLRPRACALAEIVRHGSALAGPADHAVIIADLDFTVVSWNAAAEELYGVPQEEAIGRPVGDVVGSEMRPAERESAIARLSIHGAWTGAAIHQHADGSTLDIVASTRLVHDAARQPIGVVAVNRLAGDEAEHLAASELAVVEAIDAAIEHDQLEVHYQPIVSVADGTTTKVEALVRWRDPERGIVLPDAFIPIVERSPLITRLGATVLRKAVGQLAEWRAGGATDLELTVNLSARELTDPDLASRVNRVLLEHGVPAEALWFEVTETALADDEEAALAGLRALRSLGVRLALDDFGTGFGHLAHLRRYPVQALKIDRSFISGMHTSANDAAIVRSVVGLGRELGLAIVAEGVEAPQQHEDLAALRCEFAQGWLFGRPEPAGPTAPGGAPVRPPIDAVLPPSRSSERIATLRECDVLDTAPEPSFDAIVELAKQVCPGDVAAISFVDADRIWFKASTGLPEAEVPRGWALCEWAVRDEGPLVITDAKADWRFADHPRVAGGQLGTYVGVPLVVGEQPIGVLWVAGVHARTYTAAELRALCTLAASVESLLELRRARHRDHELDAVVTNAEGRVKDRDALIVALLAAHVDVVAITDADGTLLHLSPSAEEVLGLVPEEQTGRRWLDLLHPDDAPAAIDRLADAEGRTEVVTWRLARADGSYVAVACTAVPYVKHDGSRRVAITARAVATDG
jgi:PAS domain S-box-containing protein